MIRECFDPDTCKCIVTIGYIIGIILGFGKIENGRSKQYKLNHVEISKNADENKSISVLTVLYSTNEEGILTQIDAREKFTMNLNHYIGTIEIPNSKKIMNRNVYVLPEDLPKKMPVLKFSLEFPVSI